MWYQMDRKVDSSVIASRCADIDWELWPCWLTSWFLKRKTKAPRGNKQGVNSKSVWKQDEGDATVGRVVSKKAWAKWRGWKESFFFCAKIVTKRVTLISYKRVFEDITIFINYILLIEFSKYINVSVGFNLHQVFHL